MSKGKDLGKNEKCTKVQKEMSDIHRQLRLLRRKPEGHGFVRVYVTKKGRARPSGN